MPTPAGKTMIQISPEMRKKLKMLKAQYDVESYEEVLIILMKEKGLWKE